MSRTLRVALATGKYPPEYSGAGLRTHNSYRRILQRCPELELRVLCSGLEQRCRADYVHEGIPVHRIHPFMDPQGGRLRQGLEAWGEGLQTFRWLQRQRAALVHVVGACAVTAAAIAWARLHGVPLLIELVNAGASPAQSLPGLHHLWRPDMSRGTVIVAISDALAAYCREIGLSGNVWSRPNPVDTGRFYPAPQQRDALRQRLTPFSVEDRVLISVGKFMPLKNQIFLLDVLDVLPPTYKLVLAGPLVDHGPLFQRDRAYFECLRSRCEQLGLTERVHLVPEFVAAESYIRLGDVYLLPSLTEGLGTPMLESLACAIPVVANEEVPALRQWIRNGENGFLCALKPEAWASAIRCASIMPAAQRQAEAESIRTLAGEDVIDGQFLSLLVALSRSLPDQPFPVSEVLARAA